MGVYIKGTEIPTGNDELRLIIHSNGQVIISHKTHYEEAEAVPVPPHGDLIDRDALKDVQQADADLFKGSSAYGEKFRRDEALNAVANIVNAPTIIPAEEGEV